MKRPRRRVPRFKKSNFMFGNFFMVLSDTIKIIRMRRAIYFMDMDFSMFVVNDRYRVANFSDFICVLTRGVTFYRSRPMEEIVEDSIGRLIGTLSDFFRILHYSRVINLGCSGIFFFTVLILSLFCPFFHNFQVSRVRVGVGSLSS